MEIQRLVVEEPQSTFTLDLHAGLTVAFHENPAMRSRCLSLLVHALGPASAGHHLEIIDNDHRHLVVFRPLHGASQVIDVDAGAEVTDEFRTPQGLDVLSWVGMGADRAAHVLRLGARQLDRGFDTGTDDHPLARRLAALDQARLWAAADDVVRTRAELDAAHNDLPGAELADVEAFEKLAELHDETVDHLREHRPVQRIGPLLTAVCVAIGLVLTALHDRVGDNAFTADALLLLAAVSAAVTVGDRFMMWRIRRQERAVLAPHGVTRFDRLAATVGPMADPLLRQTLIEADRAHVAARADWEALTDGASLPWVLAYRRQIEALAIRKTELRRLGSHRLAAEDSMAADAARVLVDRVIELRGLGARHERLPLLLDDPFAGLAPAEVQQLLATVHRLASYHQIVLVTGDPYIQAWATQSPSAASLQFVRLGRLDVPTSSASTAASGAISGPEPFAGPGAGPEPAGGTPTDVLASGH